MKPLDILKNAAELIIKKGNDYQNPKSRIRQADYYPNGAQTILDIMTGKVNRMHSVLDAMKADKEYIENYLLKNFLLLEILLNIPFHPNYKIIG